MDSFLYPSAVSGRPLTPGLTSSISSSSSSTDESFFSMPMSSAHSAVSLVSPHVEVPRSSPAGIEVEQHLLRGHHVSMEDGKKFRPLLSLDTSLYMFTAPQHRRAKKDPPPALPMSPVGLDDDELVSANAKAKKTPALRRSRTQIGDYPSFPRNRRGSLPSLPSALKGREQAAASLPNRTTSVRSPKCHSPGDKTEPIHLREDRNTRLLANFAYTGKFSACVTPSFYTLSAKGEYPDRTWACESMWSPSPDEENFGDEELSPMFGLSTYPPKRPNRQTSHFQGRRQRWTLTMALTDEDMSDESFVGHLERMRHKERRWLSPMLPITPLTSSCLSPIFSVGGYTGVPADPPVKPKPTFRSICDPVLSNTWDSARHALLICREIVRTERRYLSLLWSLSKGHVGESPPLLLTYLPALVEASEVLLGRMEQNPSANGVATSFLACQSVLETAFVAWCGVVGDFFTDDPESGHSNADQPRSSLKKRSASLSKRLRKFSSPNRFAVSSRAPTKTSDNAFRDVAILPTQRIARYTLLFKDLLLHTPTASSTYGNVELALHASLGIANKCNRAQGNATFLN